MLVDNYIIMRVACVAVHRLVIAYLDYRIVCCGVLARAPLLHFHRAVRSLTDVEGEHLLTRILRTHKEKREMRMQSYQYVSAVCSYHAKSPVHIRATRAAAFARVRRHLHSLSCSRT
jgi:hypothetical protein